MTQIQIAQPLCEVLIESSRAGLREALAAWVRQSESELLQWLLPEPINAEASDFAERFVANPVFDERVTMESILDFFDALQQNKISPESLQMIFDQRHEFIAAIHGNVPEPSKLDKAFETSAEELQRRWCIRLVALTSVAILALTQIQRHQAAFELALETTEAITGQRFKYVIGAGTYGKGRLPEGFQAEGELTRTARLRFRYILLSPVIDAVALAIGPMATIPTVPSQLGISFCRAVDRWVDWLSALSISPCAKIRIARLAAIIGSTNRRAIESGIKRARQVHAPDLANMLSQFLATLDMRTH